MDEDEVYRQAGRGEKNMKSEKRELKCVDYSMRS